MDDAQRLYIALIHHPVVNKNGKIVGSAVTNMDIHDIARAGRTFGVKEYYVVTPYEDQIVLAVQIMDHWTKGAGAKVNPARKSAIERVRVVKTFDDACRDIETQENQAVIKVATSARAFENAISCDRLRQKLNENAPHLLMFGTAWGLAQEVIDQCDYILEPILGTGSYNHLPVRSAVSIYLDRLTNI